MHGLPKLKVYDPEKNIILPVLGLSFDGTPLVTVQRRPTIKKSVLDFEVLWFTGRSDNKHNEIYTDDVIKYTRKNWKCYDHPANGTDLVTYCKVFWSEKDCAFKSSGKWSSGGGFVWGLEFKDNRADECIIELVGNLNTNPELNHLVINN